MLQEDSKFHPKWMKILPYIFHCILHAKHALIIFTCNILWDNVRWHYCIMSPMFLILDKCYLGTLLAADSLRQSGGRSSSEQQKRPVLSLRPALSKCKRGPRRWYVPAELRLLWALLQLHLLQDCFLCITRSLQTSYLQGTPHSKGWQWQLELVTAFGQCHNGVTIPPKVYFSL